MEEPGRLDSFLIRGLKQTEAVHAEPSSAAKKSKSKSADDDEFDFMEDLDQLSKSLHRRGIERDSSSSAPGSWAGAFGASSSSAGSCSSSVREVAEERLVVEEIFGGSGGPEATFLDLLDTLEDDHY